MPWRSDWCLRLKLLNACELSKNFRRCLRSAWRWAANRAAPQRKSPPRGGLGGLSDPCLRVIGGVWGPISPLGRHGHRELRGDRPDDVQFDDWNVGRSAGWRSDGDHRKSL